MKEVENKLRSYPFKFQEATILSGQREGAYGWITVNYLLENFVKVSSVCSVLKPCLFSSAHTSDMKESILKIFSTVKINPLCFNQNVLIIAKSVVVSDQTDRSSNNM